MSRDRVGMAGTLGEATRPGYRNHFLILTTRWHPPVRVMPPTRHAPCSLHAIAGKDPAALSRTGTTLHAGETGAAMKHPSNRELFEYWSRRRGRRPSPDRAEIEPGAIRHVLADTFILGCDAGAAHHFRIAGTRVCALFGRELKGADFLDLWAAPSRAAVDELLAVVANETVGVVASACGAGADDAALDLELLLLPLTHRGRGDARVLGAMAPAELPHWIGVSALGGLTLGSRRYLGAADVPARPALHVIAGRPRGRIKHGLVVYDGGQA